MKVILSIDGGGMKGLIPCTVLAELERRAGKPCYELFDLIAGTSIGGILACLLASGKTAYEAKTFFTVDGPKIFGHTQLFGKSGILEPRYGSAAIETVLQAKLGDLKLTECRPPVVIPAVNVVNRETVIFATWDEKPYHLWEVARATSAAQSYFPAHPMAGMILWDGGNAANNPVAVAADEAATKWPGEELCILSLGCGTNKSPFRPERLIEPGMIKVAIETLGLLFDTNDGLPNRLVRRLVPRFIRIQPELTHDCGIDDASEAGLAMLAQEADWCIESHSPDLNQFLAYLQPAILARYP